MWQAKYPDSGYFTYTPKNHPTLFPLNQTLYNPHKYCKISPSGGLAQLVEQRTLKNVVQSLPILQPRCFYGITTFQSHAFLTYTP
jgi:hypothetical protein